ncbi:helix-turn-helix domain-containing protein [Streptomyces rimosus]|uniref:helix-turn-helix domain-containing protein n=1 Tax=Streptomyces rimosus TaxID=1927 RepID=UPI0006B26459|nr:helix-turn-helix domain-containing protein [Streptomyces rimosus]
MARPLNPVADPADPVGAFAEALRILRSDSGTPTLEEMHRRSGVSAGTLSAAHSGAKLPSREAMLAYVVACGGDTEQWLLRWNRVRLLSELPANAAHAKTLVRWANTGRITPPAGPCGSEKLRTLLAALLTFYGLSLRSLAQLAPGYSHHTYGAVLRGDRPLTPHILKSFLWGCGVQSATSVEAWLGALIAADPSQAARLAQSATPARAKPPSRQKLSHSVSDGTVDSRAGEKEAEPPVPFPATPVTDRERARYLRILSKVDLVEYALDARRRHGAGQPPKWAMLESAVRMLADALTPTGPVPGMPEDLPEVWRREGGPSHQFLRTYLPLVITDPRLQRRVQTALRSGYAALRSIEQTSPSRTTTITFSDHGMRDYRLTAPASSRMLADAPKSAG